MKKILFLVMMIIVSTSVFGAIVSVNNYDPSPAEAGKFVNVWFKVENPTNDAEENLFIEIFPKDGLSLTPGEESRKRIGILPARSSDTIQYRLKVETDAFDGPNEIEVHLIQDGVIDKTDLDIEVVEKDFKDVNLDIGDIESDPTRIKPDDNNVELTVTLQNLGDGRAQAVRSEVLDLPSGITLTESYSGTSLLGNIEADGTSEARFYFDVAESVPAGEYEATLSLTYKYKPDEEEDEYVFGQAELPLRIAVRSIPLYNITLAELNPGILRAGDEDVKLRLTIQNVGEKEGESVRLKVFGKTEQPFTFQTSSDFISPELLPGETGQATLEFDIDEDANIQDYFLDIEIKNVVDDDVLTYRKKVRVPVSLPMQQRPTGIIVTAVIVIAAFIGYMVYRNRKNKKEATKKVSKKSDDYLSRLAKEKKK